MRIVCAFAAFAVSAVALCKPIAGICQAVVASAQAPPAKASSARPVIDTAKPLEGRLFFAVGERQRLDQARKRGLVVSDDGVFVGAPPNVLNGFVKRSDGKAAIWVDGEVRWNAQSQNTQSLVPSNVGGPATYVQSTSGETQLALPKPNVQAKKVLKARVRKTTVPRLLP